MTHLLQQPILSPGAVVLAQPPRCSARLRLRRPHLRATTAGFGLICFATMRMNNLGSPAAEKGLQ